MTKTEAKVARIPDCDLCPKSAKPYPAVVDARTNNGQWAYMCDAHWRQYSPIYPQLGTGIGQRLILSGD